jgi:WD40-like Beta Propeller Repeat
MKPKLVATALTLAAATLAQSPPSASTAKHPFTFEDMMKLKRLDEPVPSPDGKWVVFSAIDVDLDANTKISHLWIVPASGGESRRLNETPNHEERPRFSPDGKRLIWTSRATDPTQIWMCDFDPEAGRLIGKPHQVTSISTGADGAIWSPDGKNIVFVSAVYPDCNPVAAATSGVTSDDCNKQRDEKLKSSKTDASWNPDLGIWCFSARRRAPECIHFVDLRKFHDFAAPDAFKNRFDNPLVLQAFFAPRIRFAIVHHAICHVIELVGELVGLANLWQRRFVRLGEHFQTTIGK